MDNIPTTLALAKTVKANKQKINDIESEGLNAQVIRDTQLLEQATTLSMKKQN